jgi:hypothetical protein
MQSSVVGKVVFFCFHVSMFLTQLSFVGWFSPIRSTPSSDDEKLDQCAQRLPDARH